MAWWAVVLVLILVVNVYIQYKWPMAVWLKALSIAVLLVGIMLSARMIAQEAPNPIHLLLVGLMLSFVFSTRRLSTPRR